jgi:hypothetical protein
MDLAAPEAAAEFELLIKILTLEAEGDLSNI